MKPNELTNWYCGATLRPILLEGLPKSSGAMASGQWPPRVRPVAAGVAVSCRARGNLLPPQGSENMVQGPGGCLVSKKYVSMGTPQTYTCGVEWTSTKND